jgi:hypothetical protein
MNPEDIKNIIETLLKTGEFLAVKSFELAMRKAYFIGVWDIIGGILFLILGIVGLFLGRYLIKNFDDLDNEDMVGITGGVSFLLIFFGFILGFLLLYSGTEWLFNPELGAIKILVGLLKGITP